MAVTYTIVLPEPAQARGDDPALAFSAHGADGLAQQLEQALRSDQLFQAWCRQHEDPDDVDPLLAATDPQACVTGQQDDLRIVLNVTTSLPSAVLRHRLRLLAGPHWQLREVRQP